MLSHIRQRVAGFTFLVIVAASVIGCINVQVIDRTPSMVKLTPTQEYERAEHNLAVLAVDFDPPLEYEEIIARRDRGEGITLLVAVENNGIVTEHDVPVEVELSKDGGDTLFLHKEGRIEAIAPGEIKLVHFKDTEIPFSYKYELCVRVSAVDGETRLLDNEKTYDLLVTKP